MFERFAACGSVAAVWLWLREQGLKFPLQPAATAAAEISGSTADLPRGAQVLTHPAYAGAYAYGRTRAERYIDATASRPPAGGCCPGTRVAGADHRPSPPGTSTGTPTWPTSGGSPRTSARPRSAAAPARSGKAARCCRAWRSAGSAAASSPCSTAGRTSTPGYHCTGTVLSSVDGRGRFCTRVGGLRIDAAVAARVLAALTPLALQACLQAAQELEASHDAALEQWRRQAEQARYAATRAERRYRAVDPENRLVARGLEAEWEHALRGQADAEAELARRQAARPATLTEAEKAAILELGDDLHAIWSAPATTDRDRKQLLHALLDDVVITADAASRTARLVLHWKGGLISQVDAALPKPRPPYRTSEDTVSLIGRLAAHYDDSMIAKVLNQQQRRTATGMSFTPVNVATIRKRHGIPACQDRDDPDPDGEVMSVHQAAAELGITASTLYRWLNDGFVPGEQITPGAPWRIRLTGSIRDLVADDAPDGWVPVQVATASLGVSRQTVLQRVKRGDLHAVHIRAGRRKGLRIELPAPQDGLF